MVAAGRAIRRNKLRAALTMLGIFIGVAAVITMVAVGDGAQSSVEAQINSLGTNLLIVLPGRDDRQRRARGLRQPLDPDASAMREAIAQGGGPVALVTYIDRQLAQVVYGNRNWSTNIQGTTLELLRDSRLAARRSGASSPTPRKRPARAVACSDRRW